MPDTRTDDRAPSLAPEGTRQQGTSVGGMASTADAGLADAEQRSMEEREDDPVAAPIGVRAGAGTQGSGPARHRSEPPARPAPEAHEIDEPPDEGAIESLGRSIGEVVLGSDEEEREARERGR